MQWEMRRVLIWGKTRPEVSTKYNEIVCTGGVFEDTGRLVRLYPIPLRYLDDAKVFRKYQWIEAEVCKAPNDPRPESYRIRADRIKVGELIKPGRGNWDERAKWILRPGNVIASVEEIQSRQAKEGTSLGLVRPKVVLDVASVPFSKKEQEDFWSKYHAVVKNRDLPFDGIDQQPRKPLTPPDFRFKVRFACNGDACSGSHEFSILDWEVDALYFDQVAQGRSKSVARDKVIHKVEEICSPKNDLHLFLGNISSYPQVFTVVGFWWPRRPEPPVKTLFD